MAPPLLSLPLCILPPGSGSPRLVCYCERDSGGDGDRDDFNLYVTDAAELWSTCFSPDSLARLKARFGLSGAEDIHSRFRAACQQQAVTVSLQEDRALITLSGDTPALAFDLSKVPSPEAAPRLQALTLSLAEHVCNLERRLAAAEETITSPKKNTQPAGTQFLPDDKSSLWGSPEAFPNCQWSPDTPNLYIFAKLTLQIHKEGMKWTYNMSMA
ncbi:protein PAXX isoform X8 [Mus musculus]|uniref:protein PAXX isoform X8 n=1 Tax=Mus musculus TaxID=10090 RepID=UPI0011AEBCAC|nr:protein PAXX isoform X8 [Mus musculus]